MTRKLSVTLSQNESRDIVSQDPQEGFAEHGVGRIALVMGHMLANPSIPSRSKRLPNRVVVKQKRSSDLLATPPLIKQDQRIGPPRHAMFRFPVPSQLGQALAVIIRQKAAMLRRRILSTPPGRRSFLRFLTESEYR